MRLTKLQVARRIDRLADIRAQIHRLDDKAHDLTVALKKVGGGESRKWVAELVRIRAHVRRVAAYEQLKLIPKAA